MKGAVGNAFIMNMVITFILIFYTLLIGSMAYSKAYRTKNYLINMLDEFDRNGKGDFASTENLKNEWFDTTNDFLRKTGYPLSTNETNNCKRTIDEYYKLYLGNGAGRYDYCIYKRKDITANDHNLTIEQRYNYMVLVYMKLDVPVLGQYMKFPIRGETKQYIIYR